MLSHSVSSNILKSAQNQNTNIIAAYMNGYSIAIPTYAATKCLNVSPSKSGTTPSTHNKHKTITFLVLSLSPVVSSFGGGLSHVKKRMFVLCSANLRIAASHFG